MPSKIEQNKKEQYGINDCKPTILNYTQLMTGDGIFIVVNLPIKPAPYFEDDAYISTGKSKKNPALEKAPQRRKKTANNYKEENEIIQPSELESIMEKHCKLKHACSNIHSCKEIVNILKSSDPERGTEAYKLLTKSYDEAESKE